MSWFTKLFKKEEIKAKEEVANPIIVIDPLTPGYCGETCEICKKVIEMKRWKKIQNVYFHKSCFKKEKNKMWLSGVVK
jgi:hypothetical protein